MGERFERDPLTPVGVCGFRSSRLALVVGEGEFSAEAKMLAISRSTFHDMLRQCGPPGGPEKVMATLLDK